MKKGIQIAIAIFIAVFAVGMAKGFINQKDKNVSKNILQVLKNNCSCKDIKLTMFSEGLQFSKTDGFSKEKADYQLTDCDFLNFKEEAKRICQLLKNEVEDLKDFDLITLDFLSNAEYKTITIENGKLNYDEN